MSFAIAVTPHPLRKAAASLLDAARDALETRNVHIPALPWAVAGLLTAGAPPPLPWFVNALTSNDALSSAVLRMANSPSYQPRTPIMSVAQAGTRLGVNAIAEMALAASVRTQLFCVEGFENELREMWQQALAAAVFARELGRSCGISGLEGFTCGLLHEIGRPLALAEAVRRCPDCGWVATRPETRQAVLSVAAALAPLAGACIVEAWNLPDLLASAIVRHDPSFRVTESPRATVAHMATQMAGSLYRRESPWDLGGRHAVAVNDATAAALPDLGYSVRTWVDSLTV